MMEVEVAFKVEERRHGLIPRNLLRLRVDRPPDRDAEQISINLQAAPSFEAFGRHIESLNPFAFWAQAMQMAWLPWQVAVRIMMPVGLTLPPAEGWLRRGEKEIAQLPGGSHGAG
jgi:hypothetical protein